MIDCHVIVIAQYWAGSVNDWNTHYSDNLGHELDVDVAAHEHSYVREVKKSRGVAIPLSKNADVNEDDTALKLSGKERYLIVTFDTSCSGESPFNYVEINALDLDDACRYGAYYKKQFDADDFCVILLTEHKRLYVPEPEVVPPSGWQKLKAFFTNDIF